MDNAFSLSLLPRSFHVAPYIPVLYPNRTSEGWTVVRVVLKDRFNKDYPDLAKSESFGHGISVTDKEPCKPEEIAPRVEAILRQSWGLADSAKQSMRLQHSYQFDAEWGANLEANTIMNAVALFDRQKLSAMITQPFMEYRRGEKLPFIRDAVVALPLSSIGVTQEALGDRSVASRFFVAKDITTFVTMPDGEKTIVNLKGLMCQENVFAQLEGKGEYVPFRPDEALKIQSGLMALLR